MWAWAIRRKTQAYSDTALCQESEYIPVGPGPSLSLKFPECSNLYCYCYVVFDPPQTVDVSEPGSQVQHILIHA